MLDTLIKIGKQLSEERGEWDDIIDVPDIAEEQAKGMTSLTALLFFDLDTNQVVLDRAQVKIFDPIDAYEYKNIKIQGGNNKAIYTTVCPKKSFDQIRKTFFGQPDKAGNRPAQGQFTEAIERDFPSLKESILYQILKRTFALSDTFSAKFYDQEKKRSDFNKAIQILKISNNERIILLSTIVKCQELGINSPIPLSKITGHDEFMRSKFLEKNETKNQNPSIKKLCYATGVPTVDVLGINIPSRYSINKMFVTTTKNYASNFDNKSFSNNYQASSLAQLYLERGSSYLLNNHLVKIAGIDHIIIPHFFSNEEVDPNALMQRLSKKSELLFNYQQVTGLIDQIDLSDNELYWINFLGYESDGNFFKTINSIQDVSKLHLNRLIYTFRETDLTFKQMPGIEWEKVMSRGKDNRLSFNFFSLYSLIPVRKDKEKKNVALSLFKAILEQRKIDPHQLYKYFTELILCHWYGRYKAYGNIYPNDIFDFAARNAVFQYHALFYILKQLNLFKEMENDKKEELPSDIKPSEEFFLKMNYDDNQKAMFHLGRILNSVAYAQQKKGYDSKPVLNKINYNGMDKKSIVRLHKDLFDKCRQFAILPYNESLFSIFTQLFNENKWLLKREEALFYLLAGYSFRDKNSF